MQTRRSRHVRRDEGHLRRAQIRRILNDELHLHGHEKKDRHLDLLPRDNFLQWLLHGHWFHLSLGRTSSQVLFRRKQELSEEVVLSMGNRNFSNDFGIK